MFKILTAFIILVLFIKLMFNPKFDIIDNNLLILWYHGYRKRKYIKLFRI